MMNEKDNIYMRYTWSFTPVTQNASLHPEYASTVIFQNNGSSIMWIDNQVRILPNQSFTFEGYPGEICQHGWDISFTGGANPGYGQGVMVTKNYPR